MNDAIDELKGKVEMFNGAETTLAAGDLRLNKMEGNLRTNTNLMYAYELEKDRLQVLLTDAENRISKLTSVNEEVSSQIAMISKHENEREKSWLAEIDKNKELQLLVATLEADLLMATTHHLYGIQKNLEDAELRVAELEQETEARKTMIELDQKLARERLILMQSTVDGMTEITKSLNHEL